VDKFSAALPFVGAPDAAAVGVGHYEGGEPLVARHRPPVSRDLAPLLRRHAAPVALAAAHFALRREDREGDIQPFRYREWLFTQAGNVEPFDGETGVSLAIPTYIQKNIRGRTSGEMLFHQVMAFLHRQKPGGSERSGPDLLRSALKAALSLSAFKQKDRPCDCSVMLTDGNVILGATLGRPVYMRHYKGLDGCVCTIGDEAHQSVFHSSVRGIVFLDTDALPSTEWETIGPNHLFQVDTSLNVETFALE